MVQALVVWCKAKLGIVQTLLYKQNWVALNEIQDPFDHLLFIFKVLLLGTAFFPFEKDCDSKKIQKNNNPSIDQNYICNNCVPKGLINNQDLSQLTLAIWYQIGSVLNND